MRYCRTDNDGNIPRTLRRFAGRPGKGAARFLLLSTGGPGRRGGPRQQERVGAVTLGTSRFGPSGHGGKSRRARGATALANPE
jgi:hypothetical protein